MPRAKHLLNRIALGSLLIAFCAATAAGQAPRVKKTVPANGAVDVDPDLREIVVEFDQDMVRNSHSWVGGGPMFPELRGEPIWRSARVAVLRVKLEPDRKYVIRINSPTFRNFKGRGGESARPYMLRFRTAGGGAETLVSVEDNRNAIEDLREAINQRYSYRDLHKIDWDAVIDEHQSVLENAETTHAFAREAGKMLARNKDRHVFLKVGDVSYASHTRRLRPNCNIAVVRKLVPHYKKQNDVVATGRFDDNIGYINIRALPGNQASAFAAALDALDEFADTKGLIVDLRLNSGGSETLAQQFAGCFVEKTTPYARHVSRDVDSPGGFTKPITRVFVPAEGRKRYRGKVAVLTGRAVMSSAEAFLLMMKQVPRCKLFGETSYGSSGNPKPTQLSNGVTVFLPSWKAMTLEGEFLEGKGIAADVTVKISASEYVRSDPVLEAALKYLRE